MIRLIAIFVLLFSGLIASYARLYRIGKYGSIISGMLFFVGLSKVDYFLDYNWIKIYDIDFNVNLTFNKLNTFICFVVSFILCVLYFARKIEENDKFICRKFFWLNVFVFFLCIAVCSSNLFQFFVAFEMIGLISTIIVGMESGAAIQSSKVFAFSKTSSFLFLLGIIIIGIRSGSFDIRYIKETGISEYILLIALMLKGAIFPFSSWLIDATKANIFASILIHAGTIVGLQIIFIHNFGANLKFSAFTYGIMAAFGLITAILMGFRATMFNNIKKIIACLTASSSGVMFFACGIGLSHIALLYFLCHALYKALLFLSFAYLIAAMCGEKNILRMGGLNRVTKNICNVIWVSFFLSVGLPLTPSFFAKVPLCGEIQVIGKGFLLTSVWLINIITNFAIFRMIALSMYGNVRSDDMVVSRASNSNNWNLAPLWVIVIASVACSIYAWNIYGLDDVIASQGIVRFRNVTNYFYESIHEIIQLAIGGIAFIFSFRFLKENRRRNYNFLSLPFRMFAFLWLKTKSLFIDVLRKINDLNVNVSLFCNSIFIKKIYRSNMFLCRYDISDVANQVTLFLFGVAFVSIFILILG